jgi:hypothetical protein
VRRYIFITGMFLLALVGTAGCGTDASERGSGRDGGASSRVNLEGYVASAERVCEEHRKPLIQAVNHLNSVRESRDYDSFLPAFREAVGGLDSMFDQLSRLPRPQSFDEVLGQSYRQAKRFVARYEASADALERGDVTGATAVAQGGLKVSERWKQSVSALGLKNCAKAVSALQRSRKASGA